MHASAKAPLYVVACGGHYMLKHLNLLCLCLLSKRKQAAIHTGWLLGRRCVWRVVVVKHGGAGCMILGSRIKALAPLHHS